MNIIINSIIISLIIFNFIATSVAKKESLRSALLPRIFGGLPVSDIRDFPYQVGLELTDINDDGIWCGGSIIAANWILTASHCFWAVEQCVIYFGLVNRKQITENTLVVTVPKENLIQHENFTIFNAQLNDIGLIRLDRPIKFNDYMQPIQIIRKKDENEIYNNLVTVSGWGLTKDKDIKPCDFLQYVSMKILSKEDCVKHLAKISVSKPIDTENLICSDMSRQCGPCSGDSGGPVVTVINNQLVQTGLVSFTVPTWQSQCENVQTRAFTNVVGYLKWICQKTNIC